MCPIGDSCNAISVKTVTDEMAPHQCKPDWELLAVSLNENCFCVSVDAHALRGAMKVALGDAALLELAEERCPHIFSASPVFISAAHAAQIAEVVRAIEAVAAMPSYREMVLAESPEIVRMRSPGGKSVFFGYDFHLHPAGVSLIEINTNAGGAMLNAVLAKAQHVCCEAVAAALPHGMDADFESEIVAMFQAEWRLSGRTDPLRTIAIVDESPAEQYLYPEFLLFQQLFLRQGWNAVIVSPEELTFRDSRLWHDGRPIDLVYNRLTDFMLEAPASRAIHDAYLDDAVVLTPHPHSHALLANKRNLAILSNPERLSELGVTPQLKEVLIASIPRTEIVDPSNAQRMWTERRNLFFKPVAGFGGRAAYRGDKLTKRVWDEIVAGDYVAQALVMPYERAVDGQDQARRLKFDIRAYAYAGHIQCLAARLYQGQTTNFRTSGGGFAPVYPIGSR